MTNCATENTSQFSKDPDSDLDFKADWTAWLAAGEEISASTWVIPDGLNSHDPDHDTTSATVWLTGGTLRAMYEVVNRITTNQGRIEDQTLNIYIEDH